MSKQDVDFIKETFILTKDLTVEELEKVFKNAKQELISKKQVSNNAIAYFDGVTSLIVTQRKQALN